MRVCKCARKVGEKINLQSWVDHMVRAAEGLGQRGGSPLTGAWEKRASILQVCNEDSFRSHNQDCSQSVLLWPFHVDQSRGATSPDSLWIFTMVAFTSTDSQEREILSCCTAEHNPYDGGLGGDLAWWRLFSGCHWRYPERSKISWRSPISLPHSHTLIAELFQHDSVSLHWETVAAQALAQNAVPLLR